MIPEPQTPVTPVVCGRRAEARLVRPQIAADHLEPGLERRPVDAHPLDRARRRALAARDLRPLEGRAGRRGAGEQALAVAEHDLGVGADVDQQRELVPEVRPLGEHDARRVRADMAGDAGQRIDEGARRDIEAEVAGARFVGRVDRQRERRPAELGRIEAENEVMHDRVADDRHFEDLAARNAGLARGLADQPVHRLAHRPRQLPVAARVHHHVGDAAHEVFAESDLRVHRPDGGDDLAAHKIGQVGGDRGRADVDRDAVGALGEAGHDRNDVAALAQRGGDFPSPGAQRFLQGGERGEIGGRPGEAPLLAERLLQAAKIARGLVHVRFGDLDVVKAHDRIDLDRMRLGALAHDLPVDLAFGRNVDDEIAAYPGLAPEPPAGGESAALVGIAALDLAPRRDMSGARADRMLGELALGDVDLAAAANTPPAADRIEIGAELAGSGEQARSIGELAALARGGEDDAMGAQRQSLTLAPVCAPRAGRLRRPPRPPAPARDICGSTGRSWDRGPSRRRPRKSPGCLRRAADS